MPTLDFLTGFNHRVATADKVIGHNTGGGTIDTGTVRYAGGAAFKLASSASTAWAQLYPNLGGPDGGNILVAVCYVNFSLLPSANLPVLFGTPGSAGNGGIGFNFATSQFCIYTRTTVAPADAFTNPGGPTITVGAWYRIEFLLNATSNPWLVDVQVATADASAVLLTQGSVANAGASLSSGSGSGLFVGDANAASTVTAFFTDVATSLQSADYPIGPISIYGYSPNAVGTHNLDASTSQFFFREAGAPGALTALTTSETTSYQDIDELPLDADSLAVVVEPILGSNAISRIGTNAVASATNVPPAHAVGDLILVFAWRSSSATAPTLPGTYVSLGTSTVSGGSARSVLMAYRIATATSGEGATFTNASDTITVIYRNAQSPVAGDITFTQGTVQTITYGAKTISDHVHSWAAGFIGTTLTATGNSTLAPTGMTNAASVGTAPSAGVHDTNAVRATDWASTNTTGTGAGNWITAVIEIKATPTSTQPTNTWYAEYDFVGETNLVSAPLAVRALVAQNLDSAVSSTWAAKLFDAAQGTNVEDISNSSISAAAKAYAGKTFTQRPNTGGAWTLAALNALRLRFGYTAAASGNPRLEAAMLEAAFVPPVLLPPAPYVPVRFIGIG